VNTLQRYLADWPGLSCGRDGLASGSAQRERRSCSLRWEGTDTILFCSRYADRDSMNHKGRPRSGVNSVKEVEWERGWTRNDGTRHGDFVSYTLVDAASGETKSAIWWQDDIQPVACMIHGPAGADDVLLDAFQRHDYTLTGPVRSAG
jgi:hypothetical protein